MREMPIKTRLSGLIVETLFADGSMKNVYIVKMNIIIKLDPP